MLSCPLTWTTVTVFSMVSPIKKSQTSTCSELSRSIGDKKPRRLDHITPILCKLYWLFLQNPFIFEISILNYKTLNGLAPKYLSDLISSHQPKKRLRYNANDSLRLYRPVNHLELVRNHEGRAFVGLRNRALEYSSVRRRERSICLNF